MSYKIYYYSINTYFSAVIFNSLIIIYIYSKLQKLLCHLEIVTAYKGNENCLSKYAKENKITIHQWPLEIHNMKFDIGVVVSFGHLIPSHIIDSFPLYV